MSKFVKHKAGELFGPTPVARISDAEIWAQLVSPQVKAFLGKMTAVTMSKVLETDQVLFPGDEVSNLNNHLLYGGKSGYVRFPYLATIYKTENGTLVIKRDGVKFKATGWMGDAEKGRGEMVFKAAMRDRRYDGTLRGNDCAVLDYPYDEASNAPLHPDLHSVEVSLYTFQPGSRISQTDGDVEFQAFVGNPFTFLDRPEKFLELFHRAWKGQRAPGMIGQPFPDVAKYVAPRFDRLALSKGYDLLEDAASHYHVAMYAASAGFRCNYTDQKAELAALTAGIKRIKEKMPLTRPQESWICALQSLRPVELIPADLYLGGPTWMQNNIDQKNLWMHKPLSERAKKLLTDSVQR